MPSRTVTCRCGHRWQADTPDPLPDDLSTICPVCTAGGQKTLDHPSQPEAEEGALRLLPGQVLAGFEILDELSRGGMGVIYKARQQGLNRLVALKVIAPDRIGHSDAMRRFKREVQAAALLSHPNIVTVFHTDLDGATPYLAMEFVSGVDLFHLVKRGGPLTVVDACYYVQQAAMGLQHAFEQGLVHRDIKPANLMVTPSPLDVAPGGTIRKPRVKILDFGLARVATNELPAHVTSLTHAGVLLGTPDYIAPEQADDPRQADIRADIYSLGGTLYFLLIGEPPFPGTSLMQKLGQLLSDPPPSARARRTDVSPALDALIRRLMAKKPAERLQTPEDLVTELDAIMKAPPPRATAPVQPAPVVAPRPAPTAARSEAPSSHTTAVHVLAHRSGVRGLSFSLDGQLLLSGGQDESVRLWGSERLREMKVVRGDVGPVEGVSLAPNGKWGASCALRLFQPDMVVQLWDLASGTERRRLRGHTDNIHAVAISPNGRRVAAGSADHTARLWAVDQPGTPAVCLRGHSATVSCLSFLTTGASLLSGSEDGMVRLWDVSTGGQRGQLDAHVGPLRAVAFGGATKRMAFAGDELRLRQAGGSLAPLPGHNGVVRCVAFTSDGALLVSGGDDATVRVWRAESGEEVACFQGHSGPVYAVAIHPSGAAVYSGGADGTIRRWPLPS